MISFFDAVHLNDRIEDRRCNAENRLPQARRNAASAIAADAQGGFVRRTDGQYKSPRRKLCDGGFVLRSA
jgi:hypothetical protein